jgi:hypothetical protein
LGARNARNNDEWEQNEEDAVAKGTGPNRNESKMHKPRQLSDNPIVKQVVISMIRKVGQRADIINRDATPRLASSEGWTGVTRKQAQSK